MKARSIFTVTIAVAAAVAAAATAAGTGPSASGAGHVTISGANRTFSFTAGQHTNGSVKGQAELHARQFPVGLPQGAFGHMEIDCLRVTGNIAIMSGTFTSSSLPVIVGAGGIFAVEDNGNGGKPAADRMSEVLVEGLDYVDSSLDCSNTSPARTLAVERGDITVRS